MLYSNNAHAAVMCLFGEFIEKFEAMASKAINLIRLYR